MTELCKVRIRVVAPLPGVWPRYQPEVGKEYNAWYWKYHYSSVKDKMSTVVIRIKDKKIALKKGEFEFV